MLNDVQYAIRQLRGCLGAKQSVEAMCMRDRVERALDALERVEAELERIEAEVDEADHAEPDTSSFTTCEECARSWGPHYSGPCDH